MDPWRNLFLLPTHSKRGLSYLPDPFCFNWTISNRKRGRTLFFFPPKFIELILFFLVRWIACYTHTVLSIFLLFSGCYATCMCVFFSFFFFCVLFYVRPLVFYFKKIRLDGKFLRAGDSLFPFAPLSMQGNILRSKKLFIILFCFFFLPSRAAAAAAAPSRTFLTSF